MQWKCPTICLDPKLTSLLGGSYFCFHWNLKIYCRIQEMDHWALSWARHNHSTHSSSLFQSVLMPSFHVPPTSLTRILNARSIYIGGPEPVEKEEYSTVFQVRVWWIKWKLIWNGYWLFCCYGLSKCIRDSGSVKSLKVKKGSSWSKSLDTPDMTKPVRLFNLHRFYCPNSNRWRL